MVGAGADEEAKRLQMTKCRSVMEGSVESGILGAEEWMGRVRGIGVC